MYNDNNQLYMKTDRTRISTEPYDLWYRLPNKRSIQ